MNGFEVAIFVLLIYTIIRIEQVNNQLKGIEMTLKERFDAVNTKLDEASSEIVAEIARLRAAIEAGNVTLPPDAEASLAALETKANALADIMPNVPPAP